MAKKRNQDTIHEIRFTKDSDGGEESRDLLDSEGFRPIIEVGINSLVYEIVISEILKLG